MEVFVCAEKGVCNNISTWCTCSSQRVVITVWCSSLELRGKSSRRLRSDAVIVKVLPTFDLWPDTRNDKSAGCSNGHSTKVIFLGSTGTLAHTRIVSLQYGQKGNKVLLEESP